MKSKITKIIIGALGLLILPVITVALLGSIYIFIQLLLGSPFSNALQSLEMILVHTKPYLPYVTLVPMTFVIIVVVLKILKGNQL
jgi:hypothetical protein